MPTISNKTQKPLNVPLPEGKRLFLGPGKTGQISTKAIETPGLKKLVEAGEIEVVDENLRPTGPGGGRAGRTMYGHTSRGRIRRSGDR